VAAGPTGSLDPGRQVAVLFTKTYGRVLPRGMTMLDPSLAPAMLDPSLAPEIRKRSPLAVVAWNHFDQALGPVHRRRAVRSMKPHFIWL
jgi:hypothetical protein